MNGIKRTNSKFLFLIRYFSIPSRILQHILITESNYTYIRQLIRHIFMAFSFLFCVYKDACFNMSISNATPIQLVTAALSSSGSRWIPNLS